MSFVACGRPFPVTRHFDNFTPFEGQPCNEQSKCGGGPSRHDSHYVCVKFNQEYLPCPPREQPDYDEIVVFNPDVVLPVAVFEFKRRRRTLLWLDDNPQNNFSILRTFPGCPQQSAALHLPTYPMRSHCSSCGHCLTMDANPHGTLRELQKAVVLAEKERDEALGCMRGGIPGSQERLQSCIDILRHAEDAVTFAKIADAAVVGEFSGRDIKMEEQVDVILFTSSGDMMRFLRAHPELYKYISLFLCACLC
jgi:hypothetical protein